MGMGFWLGYVAPSIAMLLVLFFYSVIEEQKITLADCLQALFFCFIPFLNIFFLLMGLVQLIVQVLEGKVGKATIFDFRSSEEKLEELSKELRREK